MARNRTKSGNTPCKNGACLKEFLDVTPNAMLVTNAAGEIILSNRMVEALFGYTQDELHGLLVEELLPAHERQRHAEIRTSYLQNPQYISMAAMREIHARRKDGSEFPVEVSLGQHTMAGGEAVLLCAIRDITAGKRVEASLRQSEARFRSFVEQSADGFLLTDEQGRVIEWNQALTRITGLPRQQALGMAVWDIQFQLLPPEQRSPDYLERIKLILQDMLHSGQSPVLGQPSAVEIHTLQGEKKFIQQISFAIRTEQGYCMGDVVRDDTGRRQMQDALEVESIRRRILFDQSPDGILVIDPQTGGFMEFNTRAHAQLGYSREEFARLRIFDVEAQETADETRAHIAAVLHNGRSDFETLQRTRQGDIRNVHVTAQIVEILGQPVYYCTWRDVTDRKRAEAARRESEDRFFKMFQASPIGIILTHYQDGAILDANAAFLKMFGYAREDVIGHTTLELNMYADAQDRLRLTSMLRDQGSIPGVETRFRRHNGEIGDIFVTAELVEISGKHCMLSMLIDVTDRKRAEEEARKSQEQALVALAKYRALFENFPLGITVADAAGNITETNPIADELLGVSAAEQLQRQIDGAEWRIIRPDGAPMPPEEYASVRALAEGRRVENVEMGLLKPDASLTWINVTAAPLPLQEGGLVITYSDITARKQIEADLRTSEARFATVFHSSPTPIAVSRLSDNRLIDVNRAWEAMTGWPREEAVGSSPLDLGLWAHPAQRDQLKVLLAERRVMHGFEAQIRTRAGAIASLLMSAEILILQGEPCLLTMAQDITERKRAEEALRLSEERYRSTLDNMLEGCQIIGFDWRYLYVNAAAARHGRRSPDELLMHTMMEIYPGIESTEMFAALRDCMHNRLSRLLDNEFIYPDGSRGWFNLSIAPLPEGIFILSVDITARKIAEEALNKSQALLKEAQRIGRIGHMEWNGRDQALICSDEVYEILHLPGDALISQETLCSMMSPEDCQRIRELDGQAFQRRGDVDYEYAIRLEDGRRRWLHHTGKMTYAENGLPVRMMATIQDVTARKQAEETLRASQEKYRLLSEELEGRVAQRTDELRLSRDQLSAANAALHKASQAKNEFLANMSHELRTPLSGILGMCEVLQVDAYGALNERQLRAVKNIESSGRHLLSLINDLLDLSKIEAGKLEVHLEPVSIDEVCQASLLFVKEPAARKGITLTQVSDPAVATLLADERRLKQIIVNLLSNAVKFTPEGGKVTLQVRANPQQHSLDLSVIDTGIGIAPADLPRLFNPFSQVDSSLTRQQEGTGLGLALVKELAELHGGGIRVLSEPGVGSQFTVALPWQEAAGLQEARFDLDQSIAARQPLQKAPQATEKILLVDDVETNILAVSDYLEAIGYSLLHAANGRDAIEKARQYLPDAILMDVQMPVMDGLEAARRLRADPRFASIPIVAITALAMTGDRESCLAAGFDDYVSKPVSLKRLAELLRDLLDKSRA